MKNLLFLFFAAAILILNHSWLPGMFMDGGIHVTLGKNAALFGHWLVPSFSPIEFNRYFEHPPTLFIFEGILFKLFGVSWTVARIAGFIFNLGTISVLWHFLSKLYSKRFAHLTIIVLLLSLPYIKKSRFPNMDIALTFFLVWSLLFYFKAFLTNQKRYWIGTGVFFGLALLMKGHPALFIPMIIIIHLTINKKFDRLASLAPWYSFLIGLAIFALWPLSLKVFTGSTEIFELWFKKQFISTVLESRDGRTRGFFAYFTFLIKNCLPWLILASIGVRRHYRKPLFQLALIWFLAVLLSLSCVGWKLDHYIIPLYPALAILAAYGIESLGNRIADYAMIGSYYLIPAIATVLLCFPVSNEIRRSKYVYYAKEIMKTFKEQPTAFATVDGASSYWSFAPAVAFPENLSPYRLSKSDVIDFERTGKLHNEKGWMFFVKKGLVKELGPLKRLRKVIEYKNSYLLVEKRLLSSEIIYPYNKK